MKQVRTLMALVGLSLVSPIASASAQGILYINASPINLNGDWGLWPATTTGSGVVAIPGATWSEVPKNALGAANSIAGFSNQSLSGSGFRFADNFTVPSGAGWTLTTIEFMVYQPGYTGFTSPVGAANLRIWSGRPGDVGSTVVFGDTTTNRVAGAQVTNIYRVFNTTTLPATAPDYTRRIWQVSTSLSGLHLQPGAYWLDWQLSAADPSGEIFSPSVTVAGQLGPVGANARVLTPLPPPSVDGAWGDLVDAGKPVSMPDVKQELPFVLMGTSVGTGCLADLTGIGGPPAPPDGQLTVDDIIGFINAYGDGDLFADVCGVGGPPSGPDGQLTVDDIITFVNSFSDGC